MNFDKDKFEALVKALIRAREGVVRAEVGARAIAVYRSDASWLRAGQVYSVLKEDLSKKLSEAQAELTVLASIGAVRQ